MAMDIYIILLLFIVGLIVGRFLNILGIELPKKNKVINLCDNCDEVYDLVDYIPVISYFIHSFKCPKCKKPLSYWYIFIEIAGGVLFSLSYIMYGFSYEMIAMLVMVCLLLLIYVSDFKYYIILDSCIIVSSVIFLGAKLIFFGFKTFVISLVSGLILLAFMRVIKFIGDKIFKSESLGGGDVKLAAVFGFALGVRLSFIALILGSFLAFPYAFYCTLSRKGREIPFGPFLITGLLVVFVFMEPIREFISIIF